MLPLFKNKVKELAGTKFNFAGLSFNDTIVISGKKDSGKSYAANVIMSKLARYVLWDMRFERVRADSPVKSKKAIIITNPDIQITSNVKDIGAYDKIIFHPRAKDKKELMAIYNELCINVRKAKHYMMITEEADSLIPIGSVMDSGIFELTQGNIHDDCGLIFITRRLQRLHTDAVRLADHLFIFRYSPKDKEYLEGFDIILPDGELPNREFYHWNGKELHHYKSVSALL